MFTHSEVIMLTKTHKTDGRHWKQLRYDVGR